MRALLQPNMRFIGLVARWAVVAILVGSALLKLSFLASGAPAVPSGQSALAYAGVALLELVFAGLFLTRWARGVAPLLAAGLLGAASVTTAFGLTGPAGLACHCLGETKLQL